MTLSPTRQFRPRMPKPKWNNFELVETFPECIPTIKEMIKDRKERLSNVCKVRNHLWYKFTPLTRLEQLPFIGTDLFISDIENDIKRLSEILPIKGSKKLDGTGDILEAKQVPITNFIQFNRMGFAVCPFHSEKTGSLKYYKNNNKAHCFGSCNKSFDVIDIVQKMNGLTLPQAIKFLTR